MSIPYINSIRNAVPMTQEFLGINKGERIGDGEWADAKNLSTEYYPVARTRDKRQIVHCYDTNSWEKAAMILGNPRDVVVVDGKTAYSYFNGADGTVWFDDLEFSFDGDPSQIVNFGYKGIYTISGTWIVAYGQARALTSRLTRDVSLAVVTLSDGNFTGIPASKVTTSATAPSTPTNGDYWVDTNRNGLYIWSDAAAEWVSVPSSYIRIWCHADLSGFSDGDAVEISSENGTIPESSYIIKKIEEDPDHAGWYYLYIPGFVSPGDDDITIERRAPVFDFITTWKNRVWGCRYGENDKGEIVNEVYGSALGDCLNFFVFEGTAADSFIASVGTGGPFTGIAATEDNVYFFKEDRVYILSGSEPPFALREQWGPGIPIGAAKSVVASNGAVYYQTQYGFARMTPYNYPQIISHPIGRKVRPAAIGGMDGERVFWVCGEDMLAYDTTNGMWMRESAPVEEVFAIDQYQGRPILFSSDPLEAPRQKAMSVCLLHDGPSPVEGDFLPHVRPATQDDTGPVSDRYVIWGNQGDDGKDDIDWYGITGIRGLSDPEPKRLNSVKIRLKTGDDAAFRLFIQLDEDGVWIPIQNEERTKAGTYVVRYVPNRRCDLYRLKIEGHGDCVIYSITESYENAGDGSVGL